MIFTPRNPFSPTLGVPVDLSDGDWLGPVGDSLTKNPATTSAVYIGVAGDVSVVFPGAPGTAILLRNCAVGCLEVGIIGIMKNGTTAGSMVALY